MVTTIIHVEREVTFMRTTCFTRFKDIFINALFIFATIKDYTRSIVSGILSVIGLFLYGIKWKISSSWIVLLMEKIAGARANG